MRFTVVTIFPEFFDSPLRVGLLGKAIEKEIVEVVTVQLRLFAQGRHQCVDDSPYGGGPGMVMKVEPLVKAIESVKIAAPVDRTILLSPRGKVFDQDQARRLSRMDNVLLVCGRYEGVDERLLQGGFVDEELSVGDFVLNGGEVASLAVIEACSRMLPGAMGNAESVPNDSFYSVLLDHPHFTRPRVFRDLEVPEVLLGGNHAEVDLWRRKQALRITAQSRPDLLEQVLLTDEERELLEE